MRPCLPLTVPAAVPPPAVSETWPGSRSSGAAEHGVVHPSAGGVLRAAGRRGAGQAASLPGPGRQPPLPRADCISGCPGGAQGRINVGGIIQAYETLLRGQGVQPVALVMPDPNGRPQISLQCLNVGRGPQDATYLARDVPNYLSR